jgi:hypothetical protein
VLFRKNGLDVLTIAVPVSGVYRYYTVSGRPTNWIARIVAVPDRNLFATSDLGFSSHYFQNKLTRAELISTTLPGIVGYWAWPAQNALHWTRTTDDIMGHQISAVLLKGPFDEQAARSFDLKTIWLGTEITMFPLDAAYCDFWSEKLGLTDSSSIAPILNCNAIRHMINAIANTPLFAVVETDYFGGQGSQAAVVYHGCNEVMPPTEASIGSVPESVGPINTALRHLGVFARDGTDEFDTLGMSKYRDFDDLFRDYGHAS